MQKNLKLNILVSSSFRVQVNTFSLLCQHTKHFYVNVGFNIILLDRKLNKVRKEGICLQKLCKDIRIEISAVTSNVQTLTKHNIFRYNGDPNTRHPKHLNKKLISVCLSDNLLFGCRYITIQIADK